ncbi:MAG: PEP_CTERM-anchored TLD domain-containing protein [Pirellulales bacterium]
MLRAWKYARQFFSNRNVKVRTQARRRRLFVEGLEARRVLFGDTIALATFVSLPTNGETAVNDTIVGLDQDLWEVSLGAGDVLVADIDARVLDGGGSNPAGCPATGQQSGCLDSYMRIFNASGTELTFSDDGTDSDSGVYSYDAILTFTAPSSGLYYIGITQFNNSSYNPNVANSGSVTGGDNDGPYRLELRRTSNVAPTITMSGNTGSRFDDDNSSLGWSVSDANGDFVSVSATLVKPGTDQSSSATSGNFSIPAGSELGTYTLSVSATDEHGVSSSNSRSLTVVDDDTTAPTLGLTGSTGTENDGANQSFSWTTSDASGIFSSSVSVTRNGTPIFSSSAPSGSVNLNTFGLGTYVISGTVTDNDSDRGAVDRLTTTGSRTVTVTDDDTVAPVVNVGGSSGSEFVSANQVFTWNISDATSGIGSSSVEVRKNGSLIFSTASTSGSFDFNSYGPGVFTMDVSATDGDADWTGDSLTNTASRSVTVLAETTISVVGNDLVVSDVVAGGKVDTLTVQATATTVTFTDPGFLFTTGIAGAVGDGTHTVTIPLSAFTGEIRLETLDGNDTASIDVSTASAGRKVVYQAGNPTSGLGDSMVIYGGSVANAVYRFDNAADGAIDLDGFLIDYFGLEPITDNLNVVNRTFTFTGGSETVTVSNMGGNDAVSQIASTLGESVAFINPTGSLTINLTSGTDVLNFDSLDSQEAGLTPFSANLVINGDGNDTVNFGSSMINLGAGTANIGTTVGQPIQAIAFSGNGGLQTTGAVALTAAGAVTNTGANVELVAASLVAVAGTGVDLDTNVANLEASGGTGGVAIDEANDLIIGSVPSSSLVGISTTSGAITVVAAGDVIANEAITNSGSGNVSVTSTGGGSTVAGGSTLLSQADVDQLAAWLGEGPLTLTNVFTKTPLNGLDSFDFHAAADGVGRTFSVLEVLPTLGNPHHVIGGYNPLSWMNSGGYNYSENPADHTAFIFNLTTSDLRPQKLAGGGNYQTYNYAFYGPTFGGGHDIQVNSSLASGYSYKYSYGTPGESSPNIVGGPGGATLEYGVIEVFTIANASGGGGNVVVNASVSSAGGNVTLDAAGDILHNTSLVSAVGTGAITYTADRHVTLGATAQIQSSTGVVSITADDAAGASGGAITMTSGSTVSSSAQVTLHADGEIALASISTTDNVSATSASDAITDNLTGESANIAALGARLQASTGIGDAAVDDQDLDLNVTNVAATTATGDVSLQDSAALTVTTVLGLSGISITTGGAGDDVLLREGKQVAFDHLELFANVTNSGAGKITIFADGTVNDSIRLGANVQASGGDVQLVSHGAIVMWTSGNTISTTGSGTLAIHAGSALSFGGVLSAGDANGIIDGNLDYFFTTTAGDIALTAPNGIGLRTVNANSDATGAAGTVLVNADSNANGTGQITDRLISEDPNIVGAAAVLRSAQGVGKTDTPTNDLDLAVSLLAIRNTTSGDIVIDNLVGGLLTLGTVDGLAGVTNLAAGGIIDISNASPLTIADDVSAVGAITLSAGESVVANDTDDLTVNATDSATTGTVEISSTGGSILLEAGDDFSLASTATLAALAGSITLTSVDTAVDSASSTFTVSGDFDALLAVFNGSTANDPANGDVFNLRPDQDASNVLTPFQVNGNNPTVAPGDVLNLTITGLTSPSLTVSGANVGAWSFGNAAAVSYTSIESVNTTPTGTAYDLILDMEPSLTTSDLNGDTINVQKNSVNLELRVDGVLVFKAPTPISLAASARRQHHRRRQRSPTRWRFKRPRAACRSSLARARAGKPCQQHVHQPYWLRQYDRPGEGAFRRPRRRRCGACCSRRVGASTSDSLDTARSGNIGLATNGTFAAPQLGMSFEDIALTFVGAGSSLVVDASSSPSGDVTSLTLIGAGVDPIAGLNAGTSTDGASVVYPNAGSTTFAPDAVQRLRQRRRPLGRRQRPGVADERRWRDAGGTGRRARSRRCCSTPTTADTDAAADTLVVWTVPAAVATSLASGAGTTS